MQKTLFLILTIAFVWSSNLAKAQNTLKVMSFNIRYDSPRDTGNLWISRKEKVAAVIQFHQADIIGIQEGLHHQLEQLDQLLPDHDWLGVGRDDGKRKGEYTAIFYRKDRLVPESEDHFWLSETPEMPGSMSWETACTRMVSHVKFKDKITNQYFYHFNTHFDHVSHEARYNGALLIKEQIQELGNESLIILTGDFNVTKSDSTYHLLTTFVNDARWLLPKGQAGSPNEGYGPDFTYKAFDKAGDTGRVIDFIFLKNESSVKVLRHGVLSDNWDGKYPSDHLPVLVELQLTNN